MMRVVQAVASLGQKTLEWPLCSMFVGKRDPCNLTLPRARTKSTIVECALLASLTSRLNLIWNHLALLLH